MSYELSEVLLSEETIKKRVRELGQQISQDYSGKELIAIGVLKGAIIFLSDLVRNIDSSVKVKIDFLAVSSYGASTRTSGIVRIVKDIDTDIKGCEVLIVEDIMDTGLTLSYLSRLMMERQPRGLKICVLLDKPERHQTEVMIDYCGFTIPDEFVVGYGLDYAGLWRNLPSIHVVRPSV
ncbi:MAG: hypoxanthine phosphoribosyltransferase [Acetomicrobium sp.]|uniref:hypoxanthine phosphoribosyltransferase n=1 Tax=Acetomicrobium TaxID=49894 RepID=UPI0016AEBBF1|nr:MULTISPECIES: hypoxanthine phosphoribosyltransferase [Acetomicrobium]MDI9376637.1 hypoxanthine phosphoribosyltransferase [Synergistota bacterium]NLI43185.1 hypoxanthine phosphoribosyltransferase [Synergistaceae bacterium]MBP8674704.1 hypoxanthine phosphoribosyltransferase [Acetomicrobium sp.]MDR9770801.1 hypoxanthine phosphoribosyltransferase [Acetomicrobium sp.]HOB10927.1 hypoxanthine phosphoribosyltransferase [Acetomicrobium sp.]